MLPPTMCRSEKRINIKFPSLISLKHIGLGSITLKMLLLKREVLSVGMVNQFFLSFFVSIHLLKALVILVQVKKQVQACIFN